MKAEADREVSIRHAVMAGVAALVGILTGSSLDEAAASTLPGKQHLRVAGAARFAPAIPIAFRGFWAPTPKACRDPEGVEHLLVTADLAQWYEARCRPLLVTPDGTATAVHLSCEGEGLHFSSRSRLFIDPGLRLVIENAPVEPSRRQSYIRCPRP